MPSHNLQVSEVLGQRTVETEVARNVRLSSRLPAAERVTSVNARVEITATEMRQGRVIFSGIIRATFFYAPADDTGVRSIRRSFEFTDRVSVSGARRGRDLSLEAFISDIDFELIEDRLIGVEFTVLSEIEVIARERVSLLDDEEDVEVRRERLRIRREVRERSFTRELSSRQRLSGEAEDIRRIVDIDPVIRIINITTSRGEVRVRGRVSNEVVYISPEGEVRYTSLRFPFDETFSISGITGDMDSFAEAVIREEEAERVDSRRIDKRLRVRFTVLVIREREVDVPTEVVSPDGVYPVRRRVLVDRVVAEEQTRFSARERITVDPDNPDIDRVIRAMGRLRGGTLAAEAASGGVMVEGEVDVNVLYAADQPDQPVYYTAADIPFSYFIEIEGVSADMRVYPEVEVLRTSASRVSERKISVRAVLNANLVVTERRRVQVITDISDTPGEELPDGYIDYRVRSGDTLFLIAQRYGTSVEELISVNNISDSSQLRVGQQLRIPAD
ncbi:MAG: DUF3794 and LysM peptidoglycan-binding domain-containing protein [Halanaerobiales bacterium]